MSKNAIIIIFLSLMIGSAILLGVQFRNLTTLKKEVAKQRDELASDKLDLEKKRNALYVQDSISQSQLATAQKILSDVEKIHIPDSLHRLVSKYNKTQLPILKNINAIEEKALVYERNGFESLLKNNFDNALTNFTMAEATSPSFHMAYEISRLLKSKKSNFGDEAIRQKIKVQIVKKYSWKAPADLLDSLKKQISGSSFSKDVSDDFN